ncbi:hypothetical protein W823_19505 [Williamsia sp. D3]|nr:hypothetical protein W823_19505 [Williamsia sp. D3]
MAGQIASMTAAIGTPDAGADASTGGVQPGEDEWSGKSPWPDLVSRRGDQR